MEHVTHIQKLAPGVASLEVLSRWQSSNRRFWPEGCVVLPTRNRPKRVVDGGGSSLYWIIKGSMVARQLILRVEDGAAEDGSRMCALVLDATLVPVASVPRRAFQGWRYLAAEDAPPDLAKTRANEDALPPGLAAKLADMGLF
jgi:hypothetical protein